MHTPDHNREQKKIYFWERIAFRIGAGFLLPVLVSAYALYSVSTTSVELFETKERLYRSWGLVHVTEGRALLTVTKVRLNAQNVGPESVQYLGTQLQADLRDFRVDIELARKTTNRIALEHGLTVDAQVTRLYSQVSERHRALVVVAERMAESVRRQNPAETLTFRREIERLGLDVELSIGRLKAANELFEVKVSELITASEARTNRALFLAMAAVFLFGAMAAILVSLSITSPIWLVLRRIRDIATGDGDLTRRVHTRSGGELRELVAWINVFLEKTHLIIGTIANASEVITSTTAEVSKHTNRTALLASGINKTIMEQSMNLDDCTGSVGSIDDLIQSSAESTRQAASLSKIAMDRALQGGASVHETIEAMEKIADSSNKVEELVSSINEIASQTNLLAINAAIEATKAGDHGKGFAVVAEEVRKLAERSRKLTAQVTGMIGESSARVKAGVTLAKNAGVSLDGIIKDVEAVSSLIQRVAVSAAKQTESSTLVLEALQKVSDAVRTNLTEMQEVSRGAEFTSVEVTKLDALVGQLNEVVGQYRLIESVDASDEVTGEMLAPTPLPSRNVSSASSAFMRPLPARPVGIAEIPAARGGLAPLPAAALDDLAASDDDLAEGEATEGDANSILAAEADPDKDAA